jgi:hypothetical protein
MVTTIGRHHNGGEQEEALFASIGGAIDLRSQTERRIGVLLHAKGCDTSPV